MIRRVIETVVECILEELLRFLFRRPARWVASRVPRRVVTFLLVVILLSASAALTTGLWLLATSDDPYRVRLGHFMGTTGLLIAFLSLLALSVRHVRGRNEMR